MLSSLSIVEWKQHRSQNWIGLGMNFNTIINSVKLGTNYLEQLVSKPVQLHQNPMGDVGLLIPHTGEGPKESKTSGPHGRKSNISTYFEGGLEN